MALSLHRCNDHKYYFSTRNICNQYAESFKISFGASLQTCSAMVTTILWRTGFDLCKCSNKLQHCTVVCILELLERKTVYLCTKILQSCSKTGGMKDFSIGYRVHITPVRCI